MRTKISPTNHILETSMDWKQPETEESRMEKNKSKWMKRWWMENISVKHPLGDEYMLDDTTCLNRIKDEEEEDEATDRFITFCRPPLDSPTSKVSPKQQLTEVLQSRTTWPVDRTLQPFETLLQFKNNKRPNPSKQTENESGTERFERPRKRIKRPSTPPMTIPTTEIPEYPTELKQNVQKVLATAGVTPDSIIKLINNEEDRNAIIKQTGFSNNYIMKLQRKVLRSSVALQLRQPDTHKIGEFEIHVLFDNNDSALFIKKELCELLAMKGTTFSYWKKKSNVEELDTSQDFRLMDQCRAIFGGRSTYTLYSVDATLAILTRMESSRQKGVFRATSLQQLIDLARYYLAEHKLSALAAEASAQHEALVEAEAQCVEAIASVSALTPSSMQY